jgi:hypothetical protein
MREDRDSRGDPADRPYQGKTETVGATRPNRVCLSPVLGHSAICAGLSVGRGLSVKRLNS